MRVSKASEADRCRRGRQLGFPGFVPGVGSLEPVVSLLAAVMYANFSAGIEATNGATTWPALRMLRQAATHDARL